jgi:hypothetical protein
MYININTRCLFGSLLNVFGSWAFEELFFFKKYFISEINKQSLSLIFIFFSFLLWTCYTLYNLHLPILNHPIRRRKKMEKKNKKRPRPRPPIWACFLFCLLLFIVGTGGTKLIKETWATWGLHRLRPKFLSMIQFPIMSKATGITGNQFLTMN